MNTTVADVTTHAGGSNDHLSAHQMRTIGILDIVFASLSIIGAGSIVVCSLAKKKCCVPDVRPIFHLSLADLLASLSLVISAILYIIQNDNHDIKDIAEICHYVTSVTTCFYIITFFLTSTFAIDLLTRFLIQTRNSSRHKKKKRFLCSLYLLSWVVPVISALVIDVLRYTERNETLSANVSECIPVFHRTKDNWEVDEWDKYFKYVFLAPLGFVVIANIIIYICVRQQYKKEQANRGVLSYNEHQGQWRVTKKVSLYLAVFLICWLPTIVLGVWSFSGHFPVKTIYGVFIWQAVSSPLQGLLNSIVYGWQREAFKKAINENTPLNIEPASSYTF